MRGKIRRLIDKAMKKEATCILCGESKRGNKGLFEMELPCGFRAEMRICRSCTGEEGGLRQGEQIELPYAQEKHYHVLDHPSFTFWDYIDALAWVKEFMQAPAPVQQSPNVTTITIPEKVFTIVTCDGQKLMGTAE